jgi:hypothetical protein
MPLEKKSESDNPQSLRASSSSHRPREFTPMPGTGIQPENLARYISTYGVPNTACVNRERGLT